MVKAPFLLPGPLTVLGVSAPPLNDPQQDPNSKIFCDEIYSLISSLISEQRHILMRL